MATSKWPKHVTTALIMRAMLDYSKLWKSKDRSLTAVHNVLVTSFKKYLEISPKLLVLKMYFELLPGTSENIQSKTTTHRIKYDLPCIPHGP